MLLPALLVILITLWPQIFFRKHILKARQRRYVRDLIGVIANLKHKRKKSTEPSRDKACRFVFAFCVFAVFVFSVYVRCGVLIIFIRVFTCCSARLRKDTRQKQQRKRGCVPKRALMLYLVKNLVKRVLGGFNIKFLPLARIRAELLFAALALNFIAALSVLLNSAPPALNFAASLSAFLNLDSLFCAKFTKFCAAPHLAASVEFCQ